MNGRRWHMRNVKRAVVAATMGLMCGAGAQAADVTVVQVPSSASNGVKEAVSLAWPKALKACSGLSKYASDLTFVGVEDNYGYAPKQVQRIEVMFKIAENPVRIPASFRTAGRTCYFSLAPDGSKVTISKSPCAALCLDGAVPPGDLVKPL
jgi:hypothetical protein